MKAIRTNSSSMIFRSAAVWLRAGRSARLLAKSADEVTKTILIDNQWMPSRTERLAGAFRKCRWQSAARMAVCVMRCTPTSAAASSPRYARPATTSARLLRLSAIVLVRSVAEPIILFALPPQQHLRLLRHRPQFARSARRPSALVRLRPRHRMTFQAPSSAALNDARQAQGAALRAAQHAFEQRAPIDNADVTAGQTFPLHEPRRVRLRQSRPRQPPRRHLIEHRSPGRHIVNAHSVTSADLFAIARAALRCSSRR